MTQGPPPVQQAPGTREPGWAERLDLLHRAGGVVTPIVTTLVAFVIGGLVVLVTTGKDPLDTYRAIFEGTGLNWLLPWISAEERTLAAFNLQQTLIWTTPLILTGLAVSFAFRCGLFNIGGQGQYLVGSYFAVWIGTSLAGMGRWPHILLAVAVAALAGAAWAGIAGVLKATVGAHEVISTIMLNWIAVWVGVYLFGIGGPLQTTTGEDVPISGDILESVKLPVFWGDPLLQGLHIGFFIAVGASSSTG